MKPVIDSILFFLYHSFWTLLTVPLMPFARPARSRALAERLGLKIPCCRLQAGPLWVHAMSVGEVLSAVPLMKALRKKYPRRSLVFTATTKQGLEIARSELSGVADCIFRMPLDFWSSMRRLIRYVNPAQMVVVETDLWPGLLRMLKNKGVATLLVNSRISPRTFRGYRRFRFLVNRMIFENVDRCLVQSELDRNRLLAVGIPRQKVVTVGNIKYDREWVRMDDGETRRLAGSLGLRPEEDLWVAGSTHKGEEEPVLRVFAGLRSAFPSLRMIIAPRKIEESEELLRSASAIGLKAALRTAAPDGRGDFDVLVLDTMGELGKIYGLARVAFVGGSLVPRGGHNLLEPASLGCPVLFGPHMHNFVSMSEMLLESGGGRKVENEEELFQAMRELLADREKAEAMGKKGREFAEQNRGALDRVLEHIHPVRAKRPDLTE